MTFQQLYDRLVSESVHNGQIKGSPREDYDSHQLDCLLHPDKHPVVWRLGSCDCPPEEQEKCRDACPFDAMTAGEDGVSIDGDRCQGCSVCIDRCAMQNLTASRDIIPALKAVRSGDNLAYALIAPAFLGQFTNRVTPAKLRTALKKVGFDGMVEVALFADILTLKEALEFDANIRTESDFQLTSCCCPMWIAMIRKIYHELMPHVPPSVSPMVACGRAIKALHPEAVTVFIGPCVAKKAEAREADLKGAVDFVLTFQEMRDIFGAMDIDPYRMEESQRDHSSRLGRIYARSGGVSEAVKKTVERLSPYRSISVRTHRADGIPACRAMLDELVKGEAEANFFEGMGCVGGCVGGPRAIIAADEGRRNVDSYGEAASYPTPIDNPYVLELLKRLGIDTIEGLLEHSDIFTREFR